jgi:protein-tyrosine phosphatase
MTPVSPLFPGTYNSRDLGGLPASGGVVRRGALVRSDAPISLGSVDRQLLRELAPATALDLRERVERDLDAPDLDGIDVELLSVPVLGEEFDLRTALTLDDVYRQVLEQRGPQLTAAVRTFAAPGALPAVVFCSAGKDRTGLVIALTLGALGVSDEEIVGDYSRSEQNMTGRFRAAIEARARAAGISEQELAAKVGAPPTLMRSVLAWLHANYGGAAGYLGAHGMSEAELDALRSALIEPRAAHAA